MPEYTFDHSDLNFSDKFKMLRKFYRLSGRELADLLNYKSSANIAFFEKYPMKNKPTFQLLVGLNQLFGISSDWILGLGKEPYTEESINQAEIALDERFVIAASTIPENSDVPETIMRNIKCGIFPRSIVQRKLVLRDRFTLIFLLNYVSYSLDQYYVQNRTGILKGKLQSLSEILGFSNPSNLIGNPEGISQTLKKHPEFSSAFLRFVDILKSPDGLPYTLSPVLLLPGQVKVQKLDFSILGEEWDFNCYLEKNFPK